MAKDQLKTFIKDLETAFFSENEIGNSKKNTKTGIIRSFKDGVISIDGIDNLKMGELISIKSTDAKALVMNLEREITHALVLQNSNKVKEGQFVESSGEFLTVPVSDKVVGRILDSLGNPIDGGSKIEKTENLLHEKIAPGVITREPVNTPVQTGVLAIDALIPIGRGQRELIIGDRQTGKTAIALDTIINQKNQDMICVYVAVGQREAKIANVHAQLKEKGAMDYTVIVSASAASSAVMQFLAPYAGTAIAEYFLSKGKDVLIIYDDLSKHAVAYREMSLLLRRPPGREAYPGDVFYIHSRLLERAAKLNEQYGGGSITALPIIETQAGDVSAYIPTNVISITDGQIFLDTELFNKGILPAINVGISVSRVGGAAQTKIMKKVSGTMKLSLASYYELEAFSQFSSDLDDTTKETLRRGRRVVLSMVQRQNAPYKLWEEVAIIWAATNGWFDEFEEKSIPTKISQLLTYILSNHQKLISNINEHKDLTEDIENELKRVMQNFFDPSS